MPIKQVYEEVAARRDLLVLYHSQDHTWSTAHCCMMATMSGLTSSGSPFIKELFLHVLPSFFTHFYRIHLAFAKLILYTIDDNQPSNSIAYPLTRSITAVLASCSPGTS